MTTRPIAVLSVAVLNLAALNLAILGLGLCTGWGAAQAQTPVDADNSAASFSRYVIGGAVGYSPTYPGSARYDFSAQPLWAFYIGRVRLSTSRASALMGFGEDSAGAGASTELMEHKRWRFGAGVRVDSGRQSSDDPALAGLPDVRRTLRGRLYARYDLTPQINTTLGWNPDLLSRGSGATMTWDVGYRQPLGPSTEWTTGAGLTWASRQYMQSYFGTPAYQAASGLRDLHLGVGLTTALSRNWLAFGGISAQQLMGNAADSPITHRDLGWGVSLGVAYRCC